jgi:hypothetical protein
LSNFCGRWSVAGTPKGTNVLRTGRLRCKAWDCKRCGRKRLTTLKRAITSQGEEHGLNRFLTLTIDQNTCSKEESYERIKDSWHKFLIYVKRKHGSNFKFIWTMEPTPIHGYAHFHILISKYLDQKWVSQAWEAVGGGKIVWLKRVRDGYGIGYYLTKYVLKEFLDRKFKKGQRRYGCARAIKLGSPKQGGWVVIQADLGMLLESEGDGEIFNIVCDENGVIDWYDQNLTEGDSP